MAPPPPCHSLSPSGRGGECADDDGAGGEPAQGTVRWLKAHLDDLVGKITVCMLLYGVLVVFLRDRRSHASVASMLALLACETGSTAIPQTTKTFLRVGCERPLSPGDASGWDARAHKLLLFTCKTCQRGRTASHLSNTAPAPPHIYLIGAGHQGLEHTRATLLRQRALPGPRVAQPASRVVGSRRTLPQVPTPALQHRRARRPGAPGATRLVHLFQPSGACAVVCWRRACVGVCKLPRIGCVSTAPPRPHTPSPIQPKDVFQSFFSDPSWVGMRDEGRAAQLSTPQPDSFQAGAHAGRVHVRSRGARTALTAPVAAHKARRIPSTGTYFAQLHNRIGEPFVCRRNGMYSFLVDGVEPYNQVRAARTQACGVRGCPPATGAAVLARPLQPCAKPCPWATPSSPN